MNATSKRLEDGPRLNRWARIALIGLIVSLSLLVVLGEGLQLPPKTEGAPHNAVLAFQTSWHTDTRNRDRRFLAG